MTKKQWQDLYDILDRIHSDFLLAYPVYKNGKNKKTRTDAERKVDNAISSADNHVRGNWELYELFTGGPGVDNFGRSLIYEEFRRPHYFGGDLRKLLGQIKEKIKKIEEEEEEEK